MFESVSYFDLSTLMGLGFKFGITDEVLWGTDREGTEWQAVLEGQFFTFAPFDPKTKSTIGNHERMSHEEFSERFR